MTLTGALGSRRFTFAGLFGLTLLAWGVVALGLTLWLLATSEELGLFAIALPFMVWSMALPFGLIGGLGFAGGAAALGRARWRDVGALGLLFALPLAALGGGAALIPLMAPHGAAESDFGGLFAAVASPLSFLTYLAALAVARRAERRRSPRVFAATIALPLGMALAVAALMFLTLRQSPEYRYGGGIAATVVEATADSDGLTVALILSLDRVEDFTYEALYLEIEGGSTGMRAQRIEWPGGNPPAAPGEHAVTLHFPGMVPSPTATERRILFDVRGPVANETGYRPPVAQLSLPLDGWIR